MHQVCPEYTPQDILPAVQSTTVIVTSYRNYGQLVNWKIHSSCQKNLVAKASTQEMKEGGLSSPWSLIPNPRGDPYLPSYGCLLCCLS